MDMADLDARAYWGAIAQIVPVLALAFVIEAKLSGKRLSKKKNFSQRRRRLAKAIWFYVLSVSIVTTEYTAVVNVATGNLSLPNFVFSIIVILMLLGTVVVGPLGAITGVATSDVFAEVGARWPLSRRSRLIRQLDALREKQSSIAREAHSILLEKRMLRADVQILVSKADRILRDENRDKSRDAELNKYLVDAGKYDEQTGGEIERLAALLKESDPQKAELGRMRKKLSKGASAKDTAKFERKIRKHLRAVSS